jgi:hypothetical protein
MALPTNPLNGVSGPYSTNFINAATNAKNGNTAPYAPGYLASMDIPLPQNSPNIPIGGGGGGGGSTAPAGPTPQQIQAQQAAAAQQQQQSQLAAQYGDQAAQLQYQNSLLDPQLQTGLSNIGNSYNTQDQRLREDQGAAQRNYNMQGQQNTENYSSARTNAQTQTRSANSALQRLLGMNGSGNSSAAYEQAPYAAALQGSLLVNGAQKTYGQNQQSLDTNWQDTTRKFKNAKEDLDQQKYSQENGLRSSIDQSRASLLDKISQANINREMALGKDYTVAQAAQGGLTSQIHDLLSHITQLGSQYANPVMQAQNVQYTPAQLAEFGRGQIGNPQQLQASPGTSDVNPSFLSTLTNNQKRDPFGNPIAA